MPRKRRLGEIEQNVAEVPEHVGFRLDRESREKLAAYMSANHMSRSQALRVALTLGLNAIGDSKNPSEAFGKAAFREGLLAGIAKVQEHLGRAVSQLLDEERL